jgi:amphi-Trp domain-containing protein
MGNVANGTGKMRSGKRSFRHQSLQDEKSIQEILQAIGSGIAKGKITFSDEDEKIVMRPEGLLDLKLTATQEDNLNRFTLRISWQVEEEGVKKKKSLTVK